MGAGASADAAAKISSTTVEELASEISKLPFETREKLKLALPKGEAVTAPHLATEMSLSVSLLSGEIVEADLAGVGSVLEVKQRIAAAMECNASAIKLALGSDPASGQILSDDQKLEDLSTTSLVAIKQSLDVSLLSLTTDSSSEYDEGQTDIYLTSKLVYDGTQVWSKGSHSAVHSGGYGGSTHKAELSADKLTLVVTVGRPEKRSGDPKWGDEESLSVEKLVAAAGLL
eukprot:TRINITY_DN13900_c0_g1_i1.p1 TRINITY_DN13900_c0_g1~~TRINITY_DN13900_c0_g1_i1.p1  ORF type:complete len:246 (+),score=47.78 TRINITY_DN13900_c0_g1_i1:49-738(+)